MPKRINIRCFHFDQDGRPKGRHGCRRGTDCSYVHPTDPEWDLSPRSNAKPRYQHRSRSPPRRERSPRRSNSPRRRQDSMDRNGFRANSPQSSPPKPFPPAFDLPPPPPPLLPPPPALPSTFSSAQSSPAPKLSTRAEMKVNWEKILPLIADCVQARKAHQEALNDHEEFAKLQRSEHYLKLSATQGEKMINEFKRLQEIAEEKGKIVVAKIKSLGETDWWPVGPNEGSADDYRNMVEYAKELAETARSMHQQYLKNANNFNVPVASAEPATSDPRPLKRRRLSDVAMPPMAPADVADLEKLQEQLEALEERIGDIQSQIIFFEGQTQEDIAALVESRIESMPSDSAGGYPSLGPLQQTVKDTNTNLTELTEALAIMDASLRDLSERSQALEHEAQNYPNELDALQERFRLYEEAHEHDMRSMEALTASHNAVKKRAATPASLPLEFILRAIDEPIRDGVESAVRPIVDKLARELDEKIEKQDTPRLWEQLARTFQVLSVIEEVTVKPV